MTGINRLRRKTGVAHSAGVEWVIHKLTLVASIALLAMLVTTFSGVVMRYVFAAPMLGGNEIVQLASVALVMLGLAPTAGREGHIRVDVLDSYIGLYGRFIGDILTRIVSVAVLGMLAWRAFYQLLDAHEFGDATNMLAIPIWPFYGLILLGSGLYALVLALQCVDLLFQGARGND